MSKLLTKSRFYPYCLEVLQEKSPEALSVSQIIRIIRQNHSDTDWRQCAGGIRAMLLRISQQENSLIKRKGSVDPPLFFAKKKEENTVVQENVHLSSDDLFFSIDEQPLVCQKMNSMFYQPCCEILKNCLPNSKTANELTREIIEQYPDLVWSHSSGPVRAMLLKAADQADSCIQLEKDSRPPRFFYEIPTNRRVHNNKNVVVEASAEEIMENAFLRTLCSLKTHLLDAVKQLSASAFEHLANRLVGKMLFGKEESTPYSHDGGIDGYIHVYEDPLGLNIIGVQAKHFTTANVQAPDIQKFLGALHEKKGVFVTCSDYSDGAKREATLSNGRIVLIDGKQLVDYMIQYRVGVRETGKTYHLTEIDSDFFEDL